MEHWMIYAGIGWVLAGLWNWRLISNSVYNGPCGWDGGDTGMVICGVILPIILPVMILCIEGKDCFRRSKTQIYWDEKEGQIKNRAGKCLFDKNCDTKRDIVTTSLMNKVVAIEHRNLMCDIEDKRIAESNEAIDKENAENDAEYEQDKKEIAALTRQLQCSAKTKGKHKMVYTGAVERQNCCLPPTHDYRFTCTSCVLDITKTKAELTPTERECLKALKVL